MVLKQGVEWDFNVTKFESSVNSDGTQTSRATYRGKVVFESSVNSDGTQTVRLGEKRKR